MMLVATLGATEAHSQVFRCTGPDGSIELTDRPCPGAESVEEVKLHPQANAPSEEEQERALERARRDVETAAAISAEERARRDAAAARWRLEEERQAAAEDAYWAARQSECDHHQRWLNYHTDGDPKRNTPGNKWDRRSAEMHKQGIAQNCRP